MRLNHEDQPLFWGWPEESRHYNPFSIASGIHMDHAINAATNTQAGAATDASNATTAAVAKANPLIAEASDKAIAGVNTATGQANDLLSPYAANGATANKTLLDLATAKAPTLADLQIDPGYQFRLDQGTQAIERSAAAHGGVNNGGFLKDLTTYAQGSASQEYQNAFNRFMANKNSNITALQGVSGQGLSATTSMGNNLTGSARYGGDALMQSTGQQTQNLLQGTQIANGYNLDRANALAQGITGSTSARDNGINSFLNQVVSVAAGMMGGGGLGGFTNMFSRGNGGGRGGGYSGYGTRWGIGDYQGEGG